MSGPDASAVVHVEGEPAPAGVAVAPAKVKRTRGPSKPKLLPLEAAVRVAAINAELAEIRGLLDDMGEVQPVEMLERRALRAGLHALDVQLRCEMRRLGFDPPAPAGEVSAS